MKLKRNVVMLPTNDKAAPILSYLDDKSLQYFPNENWGNVNLTKRHLYITSDEEIKEGDWVISSTNTIIQCVHPENVVDRDIKKIIATTDKSLTISEIIYPEEFVHVMPMPSDGFIRKFIERYNAGNPITDVMVEYEGKSGRILSYGRGIVPPDIHLKVDKNNCITITAVKDSWTRDEVIAILHKYLDDNSVKKEAFHKLLEEQLNQWIEQNL